jgi:HAD superfamily phosphoserine phosphatase-like hydrolase
VSGPRFATVILDADSTLSAIEGIDWLAAQRGATVEREVREHTDAAMRGEIPLESVYAARLNSVQPTAEEILALGDAYCATVAPDAVRVLREGRAAGIRWIIVSGGLRQALIPLAELLGVPSADLHAVDIHFGSDGQYAGFDEASPVARQGGKPKLVASLGIARPALAIGDGQTDAELRSVVDEFWAYTGFVARPSVVARAEKSMRSFSDIWVELQNR